MIQVPSGAHAAAPKGAPFIIERHRFSPGQHVEYARMGISEGKLANWPMVYILANSDEAYVGQTTSVVSRMAQHGANKEKRSFTVVNIIYNEEFNASVITDYEHRLIGLMHADGKYRLTNKNDGMTDTDYFSKAAYGKMFESLWDELRDLDLAEHSIADIEESEVFKFSPFKGLTPDQCLALAQIKAAIGRGLDNAGPMVVQGMPGTGKTVLAIYLLKMLKDDPAFLGRNIRLLEPVTSLRNTLRSCLKGVVGLSPDDIIGPLDIVKSRFGYRDDGDKSFDILLVDEAHRLKRRVNLGTQFGNFDRVSGALGLPKETTQVDWVLAQCRVPIFFYDPLQAVGPSCVDRPALKRLLGSSLEHPISLDSQMRVKGGKAYLDYISAILAGRAPHRCTFTGYELKLHATFQGFTDSFEVTHEAHDLSRMVAGYAWKWVSRGEKDPSVCDIVIDGIGLKWNSTYDNWVGKGGSDPKTAHEVGCIHSIQGYDLSYAFVIIGDDLVLDGDGRLVANRKSYYDRNGYAGITDTAELDQYIRNIYYVLLTRGIYGTHIYVKNPELRAYLAAFFDMCA